MRLTFSFLVGLVVLTLSVSGIPTIQQNEFSLDNMVEGLKTECREKNDGLACIQFKLLNLIAQAQRKDAFKVSDSVTVVKNSESPNIDNGGRGFVDQLEDFVKTHDMFVRLPFTDTTLGVSPRNLDNNELSFSLRSPNSDAVEGKSRRRKNKLKKILVPIVVFVLLKALTLIPLAIGVLGLKAWNALHLSFFSFVVSIALAIFQLAKKINSDQASAAVHGPWEAYNQYAAARSYEPTQQIQELDAQQMAYSAHSQ